MSIALKGAILAANRRADGAVVVLDVEGDWSEDMRAAALARASDERRALADRARYEAARSVVLAPRLLEVVEADGHVTLARRRGQAHPAARNQPPDARAAPVDRASPSLAPAAT